MQHQHNVYIGPRIAAGHPTEIDLWGGPGDLESISIISIGCLFLHRSMVHRCIADLGVAFREAATARRRGRLSASTPVVAHSRW